VPTPLPSDCTGNGFVGAFVAGLAFGPFRRRLQETVLDLTEQSGQLLAAVVWFIFGAAMLRAAAGVITWQTFAYGVLSLTVIRAVPVALALVGTHLGRPTVSFVSWFGPPRARVERVRADRLRHARPDVRFAACRRLHHRRLERGGARRVGATADPSVREGHGGQRS
jgi:hypothetical protein